MTDPLQIPDFLKRSTETDMRPADTQAAKAASEPDVANELTKEQLEEMAVAFTAQSLNWTQESPKPQRNARSTKRNCVRSRES